METMRGGVLGMIVKLAPTAAVSQALTRGLEAAPPPPGVHLLEGVATVQLACSVAVGLPTVARVPYKPDVAALLVHLLHLVGVSDPASAAALVTSASHHARVLPCDASAADAVTAALARYAEAVSLATPKKERAGAVAVRGDVLITDWCAS